MFSCTVWKCLVKSNLEPKSMTNVAKVLYQFFMHTIIMSCLFLCVVKLSKHPDQIFLFLWTISICALSIFFVLKLFWQILHYCCFIFPWTHSMCLLTSAWLKAENSHKSHLKGFLLSWTLSICIFRVFFWP
jgi:hypothetical protein